jgi:hypothetical protein
MDWEKVVKYNNKIEGLLNYCRWHANTEEEKEKVRWKIFKLVSKMNDVLVGANK